MEYSTIFWYYAFPAFILLALSNLSRAVEVFVHGESVDWEEFADHLFWSVVPVVNVIILGIFICLMIVECVGQIDEKIREFKRRRKG